MRSHSTTALASTTVGTLVLLLTQLVSPSAAATASDTTAVGVQVRSYVDVSRRDWAGSGPRPERVTIWYPTNVTFRPPNPADEQAALFVSDPTIPDAPLAPRPAGYPLIVVSHGTGGSALGMQWFAARLASRGFIVVAVDHHGNTGAEPRPYPQGFLLWWERPKDLTVVLDRVLADKSLGPHIDPKRIGAAGFSLGGYTVLALSGARLNRSRYMKFCGSSARDFTCGAQPEFPEALTQFAALEASDPVVQQSLRHSGDSFRDSRVRAVFAMAPVFGMGFDRQETAEVHVPVRILVGAGDTVAPSATNASRFKNLISGAQLMELDQQVGHYDFAPECTQAGRNRGIRICEGSADRATVHRNVGEDAVQFFARTLATE
jgi:predicted dienelactone hydrolase